MIPFRMPIDSRISYRAFGQYPGDPHRSPRSPVWGTVSVVLDGTIRPLSAPWRSAADSEVWLWGPGSRGDPRFHDIRDPRRWDDQDTLLSLAILVDWTAADGLLGHAPSTIPDPVLARRTLLLARDWTHRQERTSWVLRGDTLARWWMALDLGLERDASRALLLALGTSGQRQEVWS
ncbi:protein of unknown function [Candidatus Hydrogenisulfobacillus filiaventi]|uniref:Uncharacterized protein n=1 Tax=Candidatus Hydrogenisulfobacillus filiaventi TaxID=2707344 RepID=A0A6F8ZIS9_9FIRM|nr:protein of unknown function [Candidatus Hydrogenisulfobacillus filiaventi]